MMMKLIKTMFQAITRWIQNLSISYVRYLGGSPYKKLNDDDDDDVTLIIEQAESKNVLYAATHAYIFNKFGINSVNVHVAELKFADSYQGIEIKWRIFVNKSNGDIPTTKESFELRFDKRHKDFVNNSYLPYVESTSKEETTLEVHTYCHSYETWESKILENHSTFETIAMKGELKRALVQDLDRFIKKKDFYDRVGRPWTRNYLLYGPHGTGKTSLVAAMAKYLNLDIYDLQLSRAVKSDFDPRILLSQVFNNSILLVEDIDEGTTVLALSNLLRRIVWSARGEARIIIFTTKDKDMIDPTLLSRMNMEIYMGHCCFEGFKTLASNYLGLSNDNDDDDDDDEPHRLYPDIKRLIDGQVLVTPAQVIKELMKSQDVDVVLQGLVRTLDSLTTSDEDKHLACIPPDL